MHQLRNVQYAIDAGDAILAPAILELQRRAVRLGRKLEHVRDGTMQRHRPDRLNRPATVLELEAAQADGIQMHKRYRKVRENEVPTPNNTYEQASRLSAVFRKVTKGGGWSGAWSCSEGGRRWWPQLAGWDPRHWPKCARRWREPAC